METEEAEEAEEEEEEEVRTETNCSIQLPFRENPRATIPFTS
jgi:hypothetical protein